MTDLPDLLSPDRIRCRCEIHSKKRALQTVAELLGASLRDAESAAEDDDPDTTREPAALSDMTILDALISRERLGSTGIGHGIALPHSRLAGIEEPLAALVTLNEGVDFDAADDMAVDVVLGLLVPEDCNDEHLKILAGLAKRFSDPAQRDAMRECDDGSVLLTRLDSAPPAT